MIVIGEFDHIPVPSLQRPYGILDVPDLPADFHAVTKTDVFSGNCVEEFGLSLRAHPQIIFGIGIDEIRESPIAVTDSLLPEP